MMSSDYPYAWLDHRVSYGETDAMAVLYHAEYIHIFERSRGELSRVCKCSYRFIEENGIMLPVKEVICRYKHPARYDDLIRVRVCIAEWRRASVRFAYEAWDENRTVMLADGMTLHAVTNLQGKPVRAPDWLVQAYSALIQP